MRIKANTSLVVICEPLWRLIARTADVVGMVLTAGLILFFAGYGIWSGEGVGYGVAMFSMISLVVAMEVFDEKIEQKICTWMQDQDRGRVTKLGV